MDVDKQLCVGMRLWTWGDYLGPITHILFDSDGEPTYYTLESNRRIYHYQIISDCITVGRRIHPKKERHAGLSQV